MGQMMDYFYGCWVCESNIRLGVVGTFYRYESRDELQTKLEGDTI
jgi:hypothetical protein